MSNIVEIIPELSNITNEDVSEEPKVKIEQEASYDGKQQKIGNKIELRLNKEKNSQKVRYMIFLIKYQAFLENDNFINRKQWYQMMKEYVNDTSDCRQYHRFYLKKFRSVQGIIDHLKKTLFFEEEEIANQYLRMNEVLKNFRPNMRKNIDFSSQTDSIKEEFGEIDIKIETKQLKNSLSLSFNFQNVNLQKQDKHFTELKIPIEILLIIEKLGVQESQLSKCQIQKLEKIILNFKQNSKLTKRKTIKKNSKSLKLRAFLQKILPNTMKSQGNISQQVFQEIKQEKNYHEPNLHKKRILTWSKSEKIKTIIFLNIQREQFESRNKDSKIACLQKLSEYMNTDKNPQNISWHIKYQCQKYNNNFGKMLEEETKRLGISQDMIENERKKKIFSIQKRINWEIKLKNQTIECPNNVQEFDLQAFIKQKLSFEVPIQVNFTLEQLTTKVGQSVNPSIKKILKIFLKQENYQVLISKNEKNQKLICKGKNFSVFQDKRIFQSRVFFSQNMIKEGN